MTNRRLVAVFLVALACFVPRVASAQDRAPADLAVSYSFVRFLEGEGYNVPGGWLVSFSAPVAPLTAVVAEVAGNYRRGLPYGEDDDWLTLHTFMAGARVSGRGRVRPFAQFLVGAARGAWAGDSEARFAIEPGGGVDVALGTRTAARVGVGLPIVYPGEGTFKMFRFHAGVVFALGAR